MHKKEIRINVYEYDKVVELSDEDKTLVFTAREAAKGAYAPYSHFNVGAALILENGEIFKGNNQENSAFTNGLCAERVALFYANSKFPDVPVKTIAVTAATKNGLVADPVKPCGSCRQVMVETESRFQREIKIILDGKNKILVFDGIKNLLPFAFKPDLLG